MSPGFVDTRAGVPGSAGSAKGPVLPPIVLVSELFPPAVGGSAVLFDNIYSRLSMPVTVLTDAIRCGGNDRQRGNLRIERAAVSCSNWGIRQRGALKHHWALASKIKSLGKRGNTLVHVGRTLPEGIAAVLAKWRGGPRFATWAHGEDLALAKTSRELAWLIRRVCSSAAGVFANSRNTARMCYELGVPESKVHLIYPGVDPQRFHPGVDGSDLRARLAPHGAPLLVSIGRLQRRKGFDLAIRAVAKLLPSQPNLRYAIVGGGEDMDYLRSIVTELGLERVVTLTGAVPYDDLPRYFAAGDVFVHPNRIEGVDVEGFGIVFLEAAATGKPVIAGNTGGAPEAVASETTGLLVSGTDVDELAKAMQTLIADANLRSKLGTAGRQRVLEQFTWDIAARRMAEAQALLETHR